MTDQKSDVDIQRKREEKEALINEKIEAIRLKNQERLRKFQEAEEDRRQAEAAGCAVNLRSIDHDDDANGHHHYSQNSYGGQVVGRGRGEGRGRGRSTSRGRGEWNSGNERTPGRGQAIPSHAARQNFTPASSEEWKAHVEVTNSNRGTKGSPAATTERTENARCGDPPPDPPNKFLADRFRDDSEFADSPQEFHPRRDFHKDNITTANRHRQQPDVSFQRREFQQSTQNYRRPEQHPITDSHQNPDHKLPNSDQRFPSSDPRPPNSDPRPRNSDHRPPNSDPRPPNSDPRPRNSDHRPSNSDHRPLNSDPRPQRPVSSNQRNKNLNQRQQNSDHQNLDQQPKLGDDYRKSDPKAYNEWKREREEIDRKRLERQNNQGAWTREWDQAKEDRPPSATKRDPNTPSVFDRLGPRPGSGKTPSVGFQNSPKMPNRFADAATQNARATESIVVKIDTASPSGVAKKSVSLSNNGMNESTAGARLNSKKNAKRKGAKRSVGSGRLGGERLQASNETKKNVEKLDERKSESRREHTTDKEQIPLGMVVITTGVNVEEHVSTDEQVEVGVQVVSTPLESGEQDLAGFEENEEEWEDVDEDFEESPESFNRFIEEHTLRLDIGQPSKDGQQQITSPLSCGSDDLLKTPTGYTKVLDWGAEMDELSQEARQRMAPPSPNTGLLNHSISLSESISSITESPHETSKESNTTDDILQTDASKTSDKVTIWT